MFQVEDFSDPTQNVARAVGPGEVKQIYKCIEASLRIISGFMDGQMGVQVKDLLFGQEGNSVAIIPRILHPRIPLKTGKRKRQAMRYQTVVPNKTNPGRGYVGRRDQNMSQESSISAKKIGTEDAWRGVSGGSWEAAAAAAVRSESSGGQWGGSKQASTGWGGKSIGGGGGWEGVKRTMGGGWETAPTVVAKSGGCGWGEAQQGTEGGGWNTGTR